MGKAMKDKANLEVFVRLRVHHLRVEELLTLGNTKQEAVDIADGEFREGMHNEKIKRMMENQDE